MYSDIYDHKVQSWLRKYISTLPAGEQFQLRNIARCNTKIAFGHQQVFVVSNGKDAEFFGLATCKNTFACPCCTARIMSRYKTDVSIALDILREKGYFGFMVTFAMPHLAFMSCREVEDILYDAWSHFHANCKAVRKCADNKTIRYSSVSNKWFTTNSIDHYIRIGEFTYGENGWNPHFHAIFWCKADKKNQVGDMERQLATEWMKYLKKSTLKYWKKHNLYGDDENREKLLARVFHAEKLISAALKFSRDADGNVQRAENSAYICGWGADKEVTGLKMKTAQDGHYTPYQILCKAAEGNQFFAEVYREFMLAVTRKPCHQRFIISQSGLRKMINTYRQSEAFREVIKKKDIQRRRWHVLCWFTKSEWRKISELDYSFPIMSNILALASIQRLDVLLDYCHYYGISVGIYPLAIISAVEQCFNYSDAA